LQQVPVQEFEDQLWRAENFISFTSMTFVYTLRSHSTPQWIAPNNAFAGHDLLSLV